MCLVLNKIEKKRERNMFKMILNHRSKKAGESIDVINYFKTISLLIVVYLISFIIFYVLLQFCYMNIYIYIYIKKKYLYIKQCV